MKIAITARGYKAPERLKTYITVKMKRLDRFADSIMDVEVILSYEKLDQIVEFILRMNHKVIVVKEKSEDVFKSVDLAMDKMELQVVKTKAKIKDHDNKKIVENLAS